VRRAAELVGRAEQLRANALRGEPVDLLAMVRLENLATRAVAALGIDHREPATAPLAEHNAAVGIEELVAP